MFLRRILQRLRSLRRRLASPRPRPASAGRRAFWRMAAGAAAAAPLSLRGQTLSCTADRPLDCRGTFEQPVADLPALNVPVVWQRRHTASGPPGSTHGILALIAEASGAVSFPWPLYIQLTASHDQGDAVGSYVRPAPTGAGWAAAYHTDLYHGGSGTSLGVNVEVTKKSNLGRAIAINIQSKGTATNEAINIQSAPAPAGLPTSPALPTGTWSTGIHFESTTAGTRAVWVEGHWETALDITGTPATGIHFGPGASGNRAIWIEGRWDTGIDLGANSLAVATGSRIFLDSARKASIRSDPAAIELAAAAVSLSGNSLLLRSGAKIYFDDARRISLAFNADANALEFRNGDTVLLATPAAPLPPQTPA
jgi:hypothetical protein